MRRRYLLRLRPGHLIAAVAALALIASATTFAQTGGGQKVLRHLGVAGAASRYTELSFVNPAKLPTALHQTGSRLQTAFTIANHEQSNLTYRWQIAVTQPQPRSLGTGDVYVPRGHRTYVDTVIRLGCNSRTQVTVRLSSGEHVDYWANCIHSPVPARPRARKISGRRSTP